MIASYTESVRSLICVKAEVENIARQHGFNTMLSMLNAHEHANSFDILQKVSLRLFLHHKFQE